MSVILHVELKGLQRYIFRSQRLKAMVGGNAQIGDWLSGWEAKLERRHFTVIEAAGGHLEVECLDESHAQKLWAELKESLDSELPGIQASATICGSKDPAEPAEPPKLHHRSNAMPAPPFLQPCEEFSGLLAAEKLHEPWISSAYRSRIESASAQGVDELKALSHQGYIALIKLDGNNIGGRAKPRNDKPAFFAALRNQREICLKAAMKDMGSQVVPLMNAGDDILLITQPQQAFKLVLNFANAWKSAVSHDSDVRKTTFAAGIVIAQHSLPIHRLHDLAEQLCGSAKQRSRDEFAVDWLMCTQSWLEDLSVLRQRDFLIPQGMGAGAHTLVLSERPLLVHAPATEVPARLQSLEKALSYADELTTDKMPSRAQLRAVALAMRLGKTHGELAFRKLRRRCPGLTDMLGDALWRSVGSQYWSSGFLDLLELYEMQKLGRTPATKGAAP